MTKLLKKIFSRTVITALLIVIQIAWLRIRSVGYCLFRCSRCWAD
mgnify:CR=1 FL=1